VREVELRLASLSAPARMMKILEAEGGAEVKGKCALGPFLSILVIECQHN
jgi:hypothetical protein